MKYEFKYIVHKSKMDKLRQLILPFTKLDSNINEQEGNQYTVRSIYYDSPRFDFFFEKIEGVKNRKKIRVRGYGNTNENQNLFFEIKRKLNIPIVKDRMEMDYETAITTLNNGFYKDDGQHPGLGKDIQPFMFHLLHKRLSPVVLVIYDREAFFDRFDDSIRLTIDKNLRSLSYPYPEDIFSMNKTSISLKDHFIFEVKFKKHFPLWLKSIQASLGLVKQAASKYAICVDEHRLTQNYTKYSGIIGAKSELKKLKPTYV